MGDWFWLIIAAAAVPGWLIWAYAIAVAAVLGAFGWLTVSRPGEPVSQPVSQPVCACGSAQRGGPSG